jgi:hypothetical protein
MVTIYVNSIGTSSRIICKLGDVAFEEECLDWVSQRCQARQVSDIEELIRSQLLASVNDI